MQTGDCTMVVVEIYYSKSSDFVNICYREFVIIKLIFSENEISGLKFWSKLIKEIDILTFHFERRFFDLFNRYPSLV
jgi:hypothetical protein